MRALQALLSDGKSKSKEDLNHRLQALLKTGHIEDLADARMGSDPAWRAQNLAYDALEADNLEEALALVNEALRLDPGCLDAQRLTLSLTPLPASDKIPLMQRLLLAFEERMGEEFFAENKGRFWGVIETRPYMRAMQDLGEALAGLERFDEAIEVYERMLELNTNDNQGVRDDLLGIYLAAGKPEMADALLKRFPSDEAHFSNQAWGRVIERWMAGDLNGACDALAKARKLNAYAQSYLTGARRMPGRLPNGFRIGSEEEAQLTCARLMPALKHHPEFLSWLRTNPL
jgi:tetratricopeptide (TPR) repeat protein